MSKFIEVNVIDHDGEGISGIPVRLYQCQKRATDKNGRVSLKIATSDVTIFVNGFIGYDGPTVNLNNIIYFNNLGCLLSGRIR